MSEYKSFKELYKDTYGNKNPMRNFEKPEAKYSLCLTFIIMGVLILAYFNIASDNLTNILQNLILYIIGGLIGLLGFIVGALAMMSSSISKQLLDIAHNDGKFNKIVSLLFNSCFLGFISGAGIFLFIISYMIVSMEYSFNIYLFIFCSFILSYLFIFIILFAMYLLVTYLNIFILDYSLTKKKTEKHVSNIDDKFNDLKIETIFLILSKLGIEREDMIKCVTTVIESKYEEEIREELLKKAEEFI